MSVDETTGTTQNEFGDDEPVEKPNWAPLDNDDKKRVRTIICQKCGGERDPEEGRVLGNNDDELDRGCFGCSSYREVCGEELIHSFTGEL